MNVAILGASFDTPEENRAFREGRAFPFPLLCDTTRALGLAYGACKDANAKVPDRITVVVDQNGTVAKVYPKVNPVTHMDEVLADLGGEPPREGFGKRVFGRFFGK